MGRFLNSLQTFRCMYNFNLRLPIFHENASKFQTVSDILYYAISIHAKELKGVQALIDGKLVEDNELCSSDGVHEVELLLPFMSNSTVKANVLGILYFSGSICSFAYLNSKVPTLQAITDIKGDIIMSLQSRLDIICDEAEGDSASNIDGNGEASDEISTEKPVAKLVLQLLRYLIDNIDIFDPWINYNVA